MNGHVDWSRVKALRNAGDRYWLDFGNDTQDLAPAAARQYIRQRLVVLVHHHGAHNVYRVNTEDGRARYDGAVTVDRPDYDDGGPYDPTDEMRDAWEWQRNRDALLEMAKGVR